MQSRRSWLPTVEGPVAFTALAGWAPGEGAGEAATGQGGGEAGQGEAAGGEAGQGAGEAGQGAGEAATCVALAVQGGAPLTLATPIVLVGPEGGWSEEELAAVPDARHVGLGPNVLRAETAAMAAGVLLVALRAGLVTAVAQSHSAARTGGPADPAKHMDAGAVLTSGLSCCGPGRPAQRWVRHLFDRRSPMRP